MKIHWLSMSVSRARASSAAWRSTRLRSDLAGNRSSPEELRDEDDALVNTLCELVRGKESWKFSLSNSRILDRLTPTHVEKFLLKSIEDPRLSHRFFNWLGLHQGFKHSTRSFCILIHILTRATLHWPASSVTQSLLQQVSNPREIFDTLVSTSEPFGLSCLAFDMLIQALLQAMMISRALEVFNSMR